MATPSDVLSVARGELGASSGRKYWDWYFGGTWAYSDGYSTPFCAVGASWCLWRAGVQCEGFPRSVAIDRRDGFARMVEPAALQAGDVVGFDWDYDRRGDHVGIFVEWVEPGTSFRTIEFNTSNGACSYCIRYCYQVTCGVRPDYDGSPMQEIDVDGSAGPLTVAEWQRQMGTYADGVIGGQRATNDRYRRNVWSIEHGTEGSPLVRAIQRRVGCEADGHWGEQTTKRIQLALQDMGYYGGGIDGDFGHHSVVALQRSLNDRMWE